MNNYINRPLIISLSILFIIISVISCKTAPHYEIDQFIVQIWNSDEKTGDQSMISSGILIGDGNILTIINYENYNYSNIQVKFQNGETYNTSVIKIDPRTSATLLKMSSTQLPSAIFGDYARIYSGQPVKINGWSETMVPVLKQAAAVISQENYNSSLYYFQIELSGENNGTYLNQGSAITDSGGGVLGLLSTFYNLLITRTGRPGEIAPILRANIEDMVTHIKSKQPWEEGPVLSAAFKNNQAYPIQYGILSPFIDYNLMTSSLQELQQNLGGILEFSDISIKTGELWWVSRLDGTLLIAVYPEMIELSNTITNPLFAKWIGIQWDRTEGKPNRIIYGSKCYSIDGAFELTGSTSDLEQSIEKILNPGKS